MADAAARFRVTFPKPVYDRLEKMADRIGLDVPTLVRVMASLQLAQWELVYGNPERMMNLPHIQQQLDSNVQGLFPEMSANSE